MVDINATLVQLPLLKGLGEEALTSIAEGGVLLQLAVGDVLFRQGDIGETLYLLLDGELRVRVGSAVGDEIGRTVASIGPGEVVGELALLADAPRSADVVAAAESTLLMFDRVHALGLMGAHPGFARRLMGQIATRLARTVPLVDQGKKRGQMGVSIRQLKEGNEAAFGEAFTAAGAGFTSDDRSLRSVDTFQHGRTVVTVWVTGADGNVLKEPVLGCASDPHHNRLDALFEDAGTDGVCAHVHHWHTSGNG